MAFSASWRSETLGAKTFPPRPPVLPWQALHPALQQGLLLELRRPRIPTGFIRASISACLAASWEPRSHQMTQWTTLSSHLTQIILLLFFLITSRRLTLAMPHQEFQNPGP